MVVFPCAPVISIICCGTWPSSNLLHSTTTSTCCFKGGGRRLIDSELADTIAYSPVDGVVLVKSADPGEVLGVGTTVLTVGDIDHPWLRGYINETVLGKVKVGSKARVTTDSYPGKTYDGTVSFIASEAEFTPKQIQTQEERVKLVYRIKIELDNSRHELKSNMPADAEIVLD